jgi:hypothetical protein
MIPLAPAYAVLRLDLEPTEIASGAVKLTPDELKMRLTVKKVVPTVERAEAEVKRLNKLNSEKGSIYFWQYTRIEMR